jgi:hypothetical protein
LVWIGIVAANPAIWAWSGGSPPQDSANRGVYEAMFKALLRGDLPTVLVVQAVPLSLPSPSAADWQWFGAGTEALRIKVETSRPSDVEPFAVDAFPPGTQLVPREAIQELFRTAPPGRSPEDRWIPFRTRYKAQTFQGFSRPVQSQDGLDAFLYYSHNCGSLCGQSGYAWLHRASSGSVWTVAKRLPKVVS